MKLYYAYENWTARAYSAHDVTVHLQECAHCPFDADERRRGPEPSGANDYWHRLGIYESPRDAPSAGTRAEGDRVPLLRPLPAGRGRRLSPRTESRPFAAPGRYAGASGRTHSGSSWRGLLTRILTACAASSSSGAVPIATSPHESHAPNASGGRITGIRW